MSYNLTIDQGNTAVKIALWDDDRMIGLSIFPTLTDTVLKQCTESCGPVRSAIFCSVARSAQAIGSMLRPYAGRVLHLTSGLPLPIAIDYGTPGTLGEDRIAAAVGAMALYPGSELLVVDAGTAVTYDHVSADGRFAGGNIAPGISMRLQALHRFTARLPKLEAPRHIDDSCIFGSDTASAMILGAAYGIIGSVAWYRSHLPAGTRVIMTGGWSRELGRLCDFEVEINPDLASIGLNRILLYNEDK